MSTVKFDIEALNKYRELGYYYFCADVILPESKKAQDGLVKIWKLSPFKTKNEAIRHYEEYLNSKEEKVFLRHPLVDIGIIDEIAGGLPDIDAVVMTIDYNSDMLDLVNK